MIFLFLFSIIFQVSAKETFYVTAVKDEVILQRTNKALKKGDEFFDSDKLKFSSSTAYIAAISSKGQSVRLNAANSKISSSSPQSEFLAVMSTMSPIRKQAATRGIIKIIKLDNDELEDFFQGIEADKVQPFLVLGTSEYNIPKFPQNDKQYFFVEYEFNGQKIEVPLKSEKKNLKINKEILKQGDSYLATEDVKNMVICFRNHTKQPRVKIANFNPIFPDENELKEELNILIEKLKPLRTKNIEILIDDIIPYLNEFYGKVDIYNTKIWLEKNLNFKID